MDWMALQMLWPTIVIACLFIALAVAEAFFAAFPAEPRRWPVNIALGITNMVIGRLLRAVGPVAAAAWAQQHGWGLFNIATPYISPILPLWAVIAVIVVVMDCAIYWQHRAMHHFAWGWVVHRLHHADTGFDVTTGVRFNPAEILISLVYKSLCVTALGAPIIAVILFELWLAMGSLFEHSNIRISARVDAVMRRVWVTPAMHRIHHSAHGDDHNHNYGFAIALWDRLFNSYQSTPSGAKIGLPPRGAAG